MRRWEVAHLPSLEHLVPGAIVTTALLPEPVEVLAVAPFSGDSVKLIARAGSRPTRSISPCSARIRSRSSP